MMMPEFISIVLLPLLVVCSQVALSSAGSTNNLAGPFSILSPFETKYYTDYYYGSDKHKLYLEVTDKLSGRRLHCTFVGDREIIAGLIGDSDAKISEVLSEVLPSFVSPVINVTTDEIDDLIDDCLAKPADPAVLKLPGLRKVINGLIKGAKDIVSHLFIFPGTKWCGAGDVARNYHDLGPMAETDKCCRDHDHSIESISRGQTYHDLKNPLFYTITNCDDDGRFSACLRDSQRAHSSAVGTLFFNILKTRCFANRKEAHCVKKVPLSPCQEYAYDESSEERYQVFDPEQYQPNSSIPVKMINDALFTLPGIDNFMNLF